jgi:uncharacterized protein YjlB
MPLLEDIKKAAETVTGWRRPSRSELAALPRSRKPRALRFKDDGMVPNHPAWPLVVYRGAVRFPADCDSAAVLEDVFAHNGWRDSWRAGIYDFLHYHSRIHEVLGVAHGRVRVQFGGSQGRTLALKAGDVAVLPAGTGHRCLGASDDFLAVGAYPASGTYDECRPTAENHKRAVKSIPKVKQPRRDPIYGPDGPLRKLWARRPTARDKRRSKNSTTRRRAR